MTDFTRWTCFRGAIALKIRAALAATGLVDRAGGSSRGAGAGSILASTAATGLIRQTGIARREAGAEA